MKTFKHESGTYQVQWSDEDQEFVATVDRYPSLSWLAGSEADAVNGLYRLLLEVELDEELAAGRQPGTVYDSVEEFMASLDLSTKPE